MDNTEILKRYKQHMAYWRGQGSTYPGNNTLVQNMRMQDDRLNDYFDNHLMDHSLQSLAEYLNKATPAQIETFQALLGTIAMMDIDSEAQFDRVQAIVEAAPIPEHLRELAQTVFDAVTQNVKR